MPVNIHDPACLIIATNPPHHNEWKCGGDYLTQRRDAPNPSLCLGESLSAAVGVKAALSLQNWTPPSAPALSQGSGA